MASFYLQRVMQRNTLDDKIVPDKQQWDIAVKFMEETLREKLQQSKKWGKKLCGRGELMAASVQCCIYVRLRMTSSL